ncbi:SPOR domain-containing protein [Desulfoferrobacter suflitae]|uniref:SPOR domain-containing protein n=1 Tax=Desulfoferrobacter suflitae TaxID=2865782 RepID=UPI0021646175|nr:SPOR domain-containing protein [Desulfoferrobacter suflitae]MCK8602137.1 SPOR domain-containing protein [Desulfoferrobacter suflitae]
MKSSRESSGLTQSAKGNKSKAFRFELGLMQLLLYSFGLVLILAWMFVFGVLVGRGLPLVAADETSLRAQILRFMGLGREAPQPPANAAESWEDSKKMLGSLNYFQSLTNQIDPISGKPLVNSPMPSTPETKEAPPKDPIPKKSRPSVRPSTEPTAADKSSPLEPEEPDAAADPKKGLGAGGGTEQFTLLAASLKDSSNAERFMKQLQAKGYSPNMETIDMPETGRWTRVLVGSFDSREEALKFAAEFNRKEKVQGLVIRVDR